MQTAGLVTRSLVCLTLVGLALCWTDLVDSTSRTPRDAQLLSDSKAPGKPYCRLNKSTIPLLTSVKIQSRLSLFFGFMKNHVVRKLKSCRKLESGKNDRDVGYDKTET